MTDRDKPDSSRISPEDGIAVIIQLVENAHYVVADDGSFTVPLETDLHGKGLPVLDLESFDTSEIPQGHRLERVGDTGFWELVEILAAGGFTCIKLQGGAGVFMELVFAVTLDDLVADRPSAIFVLDEGQGLVAFDRVGVFEEVHRLTHWRRNDLIDCDVAGDPSSTEGRVAFPLRSEEAPFWELIGPAGERPLLLSVEEIGVWNPSRGTFAAFTSRNEAERALTVLPPRRFIGTLGQSIESEVDLRPAQIDSLRNWVKRVWLLNDLRATRFAIDQHNGRHLVGIGDPALGPFVRTTQGWWRIEPDDEIVLDHVCHQHSRDTIHWDGAHAWQVEFAATSYGPPGTGLLQDLRRLSVRERTRAHQGDRIRRGVPPASLVDSFLLVTTDRLTDETTFRFFADQLAALAWLSEYESAVDLPWRLAGRKVDNERLTVAIDDHEMAHQRSAAFADAVKELELSALIDSEDLRLDRRIAALANWGCSHIRVEVCGTPTDVAHAVREQPSLTDMLHAALGMDSEAVRGRLVEAGAYELDPATSELCRTALGVDANQQISPEARWFLGPGLMQLDASDSRSKSDQAGLTIQFGRALEIELQHLFTAARNALLEDGIRQDENDRSPLARFHGGGTPLTLGQVLFYVRKSDGADSPLWPRYRNVIAGNLGAEVVLSKRWWKRLKSLSYLRNRAGHTDPVTLEDARRASDLVVGTPDQPGLLPELLAVPNREVRQNPTEFIGGRRTIQQDQITVVFDAEEQLQRESDDESALERFDSLDSQPLLETVEGKTVLEPITNGVLIAKTEGGPVLLSALPSEMPANDSIGSVVDVVHRIWSAERVGKIDRALSRGVVRWKGQGDEIFSRPDGGISFRFKLSSGATLVRSLSLDESTRFRELFRDLATGRFGPILERDGGGDAALFAAIEESWAIAQREREARAATES